MSQAASLPGARLFLKKRLFLNQPLVPGSFAAWGRTVSQKLFFFEHATCPGQLRCLGQNFSSKNDFCLTSHLSRAALLPWAELFLRNPTFLNTPLVRGSFAEWGRTVYRNVTFFWKKPLVPGSFAAWGSFFSRICFLEDVTCPGQLRCLGQFFQKKLFF